VAAKPAIERFERPDEHAVEGLAAWANAIQPVASLLCHRAHLA
jgi:hypothetical protein